MNNICNKYLSDRDFLIHMIDHHQVAVDMSEQLKKVSNVPFMLNLARNISYLQKYEIWIMKMMVNSEIPNISSDNDEFTEWNPKYIVGCYYPKESEDSNAKCEMHFFIPDKEMLKKINDVNFLTHMIPHHQVAINMSRRLLQHSKNPHMLEFANKIIQGQQHEIWNMKGSLQKLRTIKGYQNKIPPQFYSPLF